MRIEVHINDEVYSINCGAGIQTLRWLAEAAALKIDSNAMMRTGTPKALKLSDGSRVELNLRVCDRLVDNAKVWVLFDQVSVNDKKSSKKK